VNTPLDEVLKAVQSALREMDRAREQMTQQERYDTVAIGQDLYSAERRLLKYKRGDLPR
jgi:hypothetical protein